MDIQMLRTYSNLCEIYGWEKSWRGLQAFAQQNKNGYREKWTKKIAASVSAPTTKKDKI